LQPGAQPHAQRDRALDLYVGGATTVEVASSLGVDRTTAWRWRSHPLVAAAVASAKRDRLARIETAASDLATEALETMAAIMRDVTAPHAVRLRAATEVLSLVGVGDPKLDEAAEPPSRSRVAMFDILEPEMSP